VLTVDFALRVLIDMEKYLKVSEIIDWQHPDIMELAKQIASRFEIPTAAGRIRYGIAKACFEWVRDEIYHSYDLSNESGDLPSIRGTPTQNRLLLC
jgi:hypothetical protein